MDIDGGQLTLWLLLLVSLGLFTLFSLIEASLASVQRERLQLLVSERVPGARALEGVLLAPKGPAGGVSLLKFTLIAAALVLAMAVVLGGSVDRWWLVAIAAVVMLATLGAVYLLTRAATERFGERIALRTAKAVRTVDSVLAPLLALQTVTRPNGSGAVAEEEGSAEEQPPSTEPDGEPLDDREVQMIRGVIRLDQTVAREIMVPRVDIVSAEMGTPLATVAEQMIVLGHSRLPVYEGDMDKIVGVAYARDMLGYLNRSEEPPATLTPEIVRPALFIPESKPLGELLNEFQARQVHIAIVIDEYGGVSGVVTIEDLLEEIVGEIRDEFDADEPEIEDAGGGEFFMDAKAGLEDVSELVGVQMKSDGFDTIGGLVYHQLGKIPGRGDSVEYSGVRIEVLSTVGRRLKRLRVVASSPRSGDGKN